MSNQAWLDELNPRQREAATHGDGPLLVVAGAGSGKTKTLAARVAVLLSRGVPPERILLLTFTRRAAEEMLRRAAAVVPGGHDTTRRVWGGTFHAVAHRLLRIHAQAVNLRPDFSIIDQSDAEDLLNVVRHEQGFSHAEKRFPRKTTCLAIYSRCVNTGEELADVLERWYPWCSQWHDELRGMFRVYVERKQEQAILDYDDLLLYWYHLLADSAAADAVQDRFDHVLVDEYQDTNPVQADILRLLRRRNRNIMVVGDDCQSIYAFRGATVRNMLDFPKHFPGTTIVTLEQNYRSTQPILTTTNRLIAQAQERYSKELWSVRSGGERPKLIMCKDENEQDDCVVDLVLRHYEEGVALRQQAVLFRAGSHSTSLELTLSRRNIPFRKYGGLRFVETAHIKDMVAFLRVLENPVDQSAWFRLLLLVEGVGPVTAEAAFRHILSSGRKASALRTFSAPGPARERLRSIANLLAELEQRGDTAPSLEIEAILPVYKPLLERNHENPEPRLHDLEHLAVIARRHRNRREFLADLVLDPPVSTADLAGPPDRDDDWLVLSTIHSAKGGEWTVVYLIHAADGFLPSDMAAGSEQELEEELRLTYVAMTRAKDHLYVTWPLRYYHRASRFTDEYSHAQCCRFLTAEVQAVMDTMGIESDSNDGPEQAHTATASVDIAQRLRNRWGGPYL